MTTRFESILERLRLGDEDREYIVEKLSDPEHMAIRPVPEFVEDPYPDPFGMDWSWAEPPPEEMISSPGEPAKPQVDHDVIPITPLEHRAPHSRRLTRILATTIAASLLVGFGAIIGSRMFRGGGDAPLRGGMEILVASVTPEFGSSIRGAGDELRIDVQSARPGFATVVSLAPDRPQQIFPGLGSDDIRVESNTVTTVLLPPDSTEALVVITDRSSADVIRDRLLEKDFRARDVMRLQDEIQRALSEQGFGWASIGMTRIEPAKKP